MRLLCVCVRAAQFNGEGIYKRKQKRNITRSIESHQKVALPRDVVVVGYIERKKKKTKSRVNQAKHLTRACRQKCFSHRERETIGKVR